MPYPVSYTHLDVYKRQIHNRTDETVEIKPTKVVIVEGILIFQNKACLLYTSRCV